MVGTGASAVQIIPALAPRVKRLTVFQRTPAWILPKRDKAWSERQQRLFARHPAVQRAVWWGTYWELEVRVLMFTRLPKMLKLTEWMSLRHLARSVSDPGIRAKLTPAYVMGCKRVLMSNDYWSAFERDDVDLVTDGIARVGHDAVVTVDATRHQVDAIVLGTGFNVTGSFDRLDIEGLSGRRLAEAWATGMETNLGVTVARYPELYFLLGPNTGPGHNSVILMIEFATQYILRCLKREAPMVTTDAAQRDFVAEMERRTQGTVWYSGCRSWYLDRFGKNHVVWPGSTISYWLRTRRVTATHFTPVSR